MKWKTKNRIFKMMEKLPFKSSMYYFIQKNITKSVCRTENKISGVFDRKCRKHFKLLEKWGAPQNLDNCKLFEFGAGWDLFAPIGFSLCNNLKEYLVVDLNEYVKPELVHKSLELYLAMRKKGQFAEGELKISEEELEDLTRTFPEKSSIKDLKKSLSEYLKINYSAPTDAGNTDLPQGSIDFVISNATLEHIPPKDIDRILKECHRILKPEGLMSLTIDYSDHWAHSDSSISIYNYLQFDEKEWKKYNPSMHYQNRLCKPDYVELFRKNGFEVLEVIDRQDGNMDALSRIELAEQFKKYDTQDLLCRGNHFVLKRISE